MGRRGLPTLEAYLRPGSTAQNRVLGLMADGHARDKHGAELGNPPRAVYQQRVARHLREAPVAYEVIGDDGNPRYFVGDTQRNQAAWITPHKEHRSTFFEPRNGVAAYLREQHKSKPTERWVKLDVQAMRQRGRAPTHSISSTRRFPHGRELDR